MQHFDANQPAAWDQIWAAEGTSSWREAALEGVYARIGQLVRANSRVIDLGGGAGVLGARLKHDKNCAVTVWDHSPVALGLAAAQGLQAKRVDLESPQHELAEQRGCLVACTETLEHLSAESRQRILQGAAACRASAFFSVPNDRLGPDEEPQHATRFTAIEFLRVLREHFEHCRVEVIDGYLLGVCGEAARKRFERAQPDVSFVQFGYWDGSRKGLLAAEKLLLDLRRMDASYLETDRREYEITKQISLAEYAPLALAALRESGTTTVELSEALFDFDYPGHYYRRLKNVSLTLPAVTGMYSNVNATLTLLSSKVRTSSLAGNGYVESPEGEDSRFRYSVGALPAVCTSHGTNDNGHFELSFREEKFLPFEGAGAASRFRIELPQAQNRFDIRSLPDIVLTVQYTAREGGGVLKTAARRHLDATFAPQANRLVAVQSELIEAWSAFEQSAVDVGTPPAHESEQTLTVSLGGRIPFVPGTGNTRLRRLLLAAHVDSPSATSFAIDVDVSPSELTEPVTVRSAVIGFTAVEYADPIDVDDTTSLTFTFTVPDNEFSESYPDPETEEAPFRLKPEVFRDLFLILELERDPLGQ